MIGKTARAATEIGPGGGRVKLEGEHWRATAAETIPAGARVRVVDLDHLTLRVAATQNERGDP
jgi:membrane protein implicated in regulation of membrane protease activity